MNINFMPSFLRPGFLRPGKVVGCAIAAVVIVIVAVLAVGAALYFSYQRNQRLAKLTAEAPAQVLSVDVTSNKRRRSSRQYQTRIAYRFEADRRTIETEWTKSDDVSDEYAVGRRAKVCYDPSDPNDNEIFPLSYRCGH